MKSIQRTFLPGSEWLYFKLYTGTKTADKILIHSIHSYIKKLKINNLIEKWFFIRYNDPDFHIRLRILLKKQSSYGEVMEILYPRLKVLINQKVIWKIQIDTYNRELERYGMNLINQAESIFHIDSERTIFLLKRLNLFQDKNYRWMIALKMIDYLLEDFSFTIVQKQFLMENLSNNFKLEFGFNRYNAKQLNNKYRENKNLIQQIMKEQNIKNEFLILLNIIKKTSHENKKVIAEINKKLKKNISSSLIDSLINSYLHMMLNRLFQSGNRVYELILYDFMYRYYTSEIAKIKYNS